jgi:single-strand DNA-binding protein
MAEINGNEITVIGNVVDEVPRLNFVQPSGSPVANFRVASTTRTLDRQSNTWKDGDTLFYGVATWRKEAENVVHSLSKGMTVMVKGRLKVRTYTTEAGESRFALELEDAHAYIVLANQTAKVEKSYNSPGQQNQGQGQPAQGQPAQGQQSHAQQAPAAQQQAAQASMPAQHQQPGTPAPPPVSGATAPAAPAYSGTSHGF